MELQLGSETLCKASRAGHRGVMGLQCTVAVAICVGLRDLGYYPGVFLLGHHRPLYRVSRLTPPLAATIAAVLASSTLPGAHSAATSVFP